MKRRTKYVIRPVDVRTQPFSWGRITWLQSAAVSGAEELTFGEVIIEPGQRNDSHIHPNCEEVLYLVAGVLEHAIGDSELYTLDPGDSIWIPRGAKHWAKCVSPEPARMVVAYSSAEREVRGE